MMMRKNLSLLGLFFITCLVLSDCMAQDLKLECHGTRKMTTSIGNDIDTHSESYEFINGRLNGTYPATWSKDQIKIIYPRQKMADGNSNIILFERDIIFDRELGTVFDFGRVWKPDIPAINNLPNLVMTFNGKCNKSSRKL